MIVGFREDLENNELKEDVVLIWDLISSDNYIEYTICASGTEYIAKDDGYIVIYYDKVKSSRGTSFCIMSKANKIYDSSYISNNSSQVSISIPVLKNSVFIINYDVEKPTWIRLFKAKDFIEKD